MLREGKIPTVGSSVARSSLCVGGAMRLLWCYPTRSELGRCPADTLRSRGPLCRQPSSWVDRAPEIRGSRSTQVVSQSLGKHVGGYAICAVAVLSVVRRLVASSLPLSRLPFGSRQPKRPRDGTPHPISYSLRTTKNERGKIRTFSLFITR